MGLVVLEPGVCSLLVDAGRPAARSLGVPVGGAADRAALALANGLVGNEANAVGLEVAVRGPTLKATTLTACVLFGARFTPTIVGCRDIPHGSTFNMEAGQILRIGGTPLGVRAYLCVAGGFQMPTVLGSRSGLEPIAANAILECSEATTDSRWLPFADSTFGKPVENFRVVEGPQRDWFPDNAFFERTYTVAPASNRMGIRLQGDPIARRTGEMVSEAVAPGAIQVTNDGLPIVLGVDGQTIGGYPKVAHVIRADLDRLGQLRTGDSVRFERVSLEGAERLARDRTILLNEWLTRLRWGRG